MTQLVTTIENHTFEVEVEHIDPYAEALTVRVNGRPVQVRVPDWKEAFEEVEWMVVENRPYEIMFDPDLRWLKAYGGIHHVEVHNGDTAVSRPRSEDGRIKAPIPGLITRWLYEPESGEFLTAVDVLSRYILGIPGALLAAWAIVLEQQTFSLRGMSGTGRDLLSAPCGLLN